jgi:hypothetical protein
VGKSVSGFFMADPHASLPDWLRPYADQLGVLPDGEIARQVGKSTPAVRSARIRLGIGSRGRGRPKGPPVPDWLRSYVDQLGVLPDREIARRVGKSATAIRYARIRLGIGSKGRGRPKGPPVPDWLLPYVDQLGILSDVEIARRAGKSTRAIYCARTRLGIKPRKRGRSKELDTREQIG